MKIIRCDKGKPDAVSFAFQRKPMTFPVQMTVITGFHMITLQQGENFGAGIPLIKRRIMEKTYFFMVGSRFERGFKPQQLPAKDLFIRGFGVLLKKPASRAAKRRFTEKVAVVVEKIQFMKAVFRKKTVSF